VKVHATATRESGHERVINLGRLFTREIPKLSIWRRSSADMNTRSDEHLIATGGGLDLRPLHTRDDRVKRR